MKKSLKANMGKLVGIDYGLKRTGLALTDELRIIASPLETVATGSLFPFLDNLVQDEKVDGFIVGLPVRHDGSASDMTRAVMDFHEQLASKYPGLIAELEDERFTSKMAAASLAISGAKRKTRRDRSVLDKMSAAIILQSYLDKQNTEGI